MLPLDAPRDGRESREIPVSLCQLGFFFFFSGRGLFAARKSLEELPDGIERGEPGGAEAPPGEGGHGPVGKPPSADSGGASLRLCVGRGPHWRVGSMSELS